MKIVAVAIEFRGKIYSLPAPNRHHHLIKLIYESCKLEGSVNGETQGFLTDEGAFVEREEAARIAIKAGQIEKLIHGPDLFSEDLW